MKQASFQIGNSVNKEKNNTSISEYVTNVPKEVNIPKEVNKNTFTSHTKTHNKPRKLVENIYYF
jgi:hypothetical protein